VKPDDASGYLLRDEEKVVTVYFPISLVDGVVDFV
jgi:hypothetical protein